MHIHFIGRQIIRSRKQAFVFVLCVALSIITLVSLNGFIQEIESGQDEQETDGKFNTSGAFRFAVPVREMLCPYNRGSYNNQHGAVTQCAEHQEQEPKCGMS